jgi:galactokinase
MPPTSTTSPPILAQLPQLHQQFTAIFGQGGRESAGHQIHVIRAPGRVNLIGEHTDYNEGFVCPMAIEPHVLVICRGREDDRIRLASTAFPGQVVEFSMQDKIEPGEPKWANYSRGVAAELIAAGVPITGMDALISNTLPVGSGLSSSAAIMVGTAMALLKIEDLDGEMDRTRLALICQRAEHEYANVPSGIMDMTIVASGKAGHAMLLDCRDNSKRFVPLDANELRVVIANTMVHHELSGSEYAKRRAECEQGVQYFRHEDPSVQALRDVSLQQLDAARSKLDPIIYKRCHHVVTEIARTLAFADLLEARRYEEAGQLMKQSHASLRDDYQVSAPELDFLSDQANQFKGVYGARMTGGGFGGCIVALAQPRAVDGLREHLAAAYQKQFNITPAIYVTTATEGACAIE